MWLTAPNITCTHGFSDRHGGISVAPFDSLNLGGSEDLKANIDLNRRKALDALRLGSARLCVLKQVHGTKVCVPSVFAEEGDALATNEKGWVLTVSAADCYPLLFHDPVNHVIGAAHAGWRGTVAGIAAKVVGRMVELGAKTTQIRVAIGQGICQKHFEVGPEVAEQFLDAGFPPALIRDRHIDLIAANRFVLEQVSVTADRIWSMDRCSFEDDFFSYRRDKGVTGRMWGLISLS